MENLWMKAHQFILGSKVGDYVKIVGDSVTDKIHDDLPEIHPIKMLIILNK